MSTLGKMAVAVCAVIALCCARSGADDGFIQVGPPESHPSNDISAVSFDGLIPTTYPVIVVQSPTVQPSDNVMHPTDQPLVPNNPQD